MSLNRPLAVNLPRTRGLLSFLAGEPATPSSKAMRIRKALQPGGLLIALLIAVFVAIPATSAFSQDAAAPASSGQLDLPAQVPGRPCPVRLGSGSSGIHACRTAGPAPIQQAIWTLRHIADGTWFTPDHSPSAWSTPIVATTRQISRARDDSFVLTMTPKNPDAQHRSFYAEDDGKIHAEETKPADASSPVVK